MNIPGIVTGNAAIFLELTQYLENAGPEDELFANDRDDEDPMKRRNSKD